MMEQVLTKYNFRIEMGISVREFLRNAEHIKNLGKPCYMLAKKS